MRSNSVRAEFVLPGLALISAVAWLVAALHEPGDGVEVFRSPWASELSSGAGFLVLAAAVGAGYAIGALVVQITYDLFAARMRDQARAEHLQTLGEFKLQTPRGPIDPLAAELLECAHTWADPDDRRVRRWLRPRVTQKDVEAGKAAVLAADLARATASADVMREVEYRRANRQVFLGVLPSVPIGAVAACVTVWDSGLAANLATAAAATVSIVAGPYLALKGAWYQEERSEQLLLNVVFLRASGIRLNDSGH